MVMERISYQGFSGRSVSRLAALSDGVFAIAMTLLVLDLAIPASHAAHSQHPIWEGFGSEDAVLDLLGDLAPNLLTYLMSFLTLGIFWVGQQAQLEQLERSDRDFTWIQLAFLLGVTLIPFTTGLLSEYITYRAALGVYWLNLLALGVFLYVSLGYAERARLVHPGVSLEERAAVKRRIRTFQALYLASVLLCVFNTYLSIGCIVFLQLMSAIGPRIQPFSRF
jgi:TMEM175 potassium channel family protein